MPASAVCSLGLCQGSQIRADEPMVLFQTVSRPTVFSLSLSFPDAGSLESVNFLIQSPCLNRRSCSQCGNLSPSLVVAAKDSTHLALREGRGEATKENYIVSSNGGQGLMEFCPYSGKARPSSDQSFILSQGYVVKTSLMMIGIPSVLRCWSDLSSPM